MNRVMTMPKWPPDPPEHCGMNDCDHGGVDAHDLIILPLPHCPYVAFIMCRFGCSGHNQQPIAGRIPCGSVVNAALIQMN